MKTLKNPKAPKGFKLFKKTACPSGGKLITASEDFE
jgi:hypothetical protein